MRKTPTIAAGQIVALFLLVPFSAAAVTSDITLPSGLPCQAEMQALMKKYPPAMPTMTVSTTSSMSAMKPFDLNSPPLPSQVDMAPAKDSMNSPEAIALRDCLAKSQPANGTPTSFLTPPTVNAAVDAVSSNPTIDTSGCSVITRTLARGSRGSDVRSLQEHLIAEHLLAEGSATGYFGVLTEAAVKNWQAQHGIDAIGIVGPRTRAALANCSA